MDSFTMTSFTLALLLLISTSMSQPAPTPAPSGSNTQTASYMDLLNIVDSGATSLNSGTGASDPLFQSLFAPSGTSGSGTPVGGGDLTSIMGDISRMVGMPSGSGAATTMAPVASGVSAAPNTNRATDFPPLTFGSGGGSLFPSSFFGTFGSGSQPLVPLTNPGTTASPPVNNIGSGSGSGSSSGSGSISGGAATTPAPVIQYANPGMAFPPVVPNPFPVVQAQNTPNTTPIPYPDPGTAFPPAQAAGSPSGSNDWPTVVQTGLGASGSSLLGGGGPLASLSGGGAGGSGSLFGSSSSRDFSALGSLVQGGGGGGGGGLLPRGPLSPGGLSTSNPSRGPLGGQRSGGLQGIGGNSGGAVASPRPQQRQTARQRQLRDFVMMLILMEMLGGGEAFAA